MRDAVYSVAYALHDLQVSKCGKGLTGLCPAMMHIDGETLSAYLSNVSFKGNFSSTLFSKNCYLFKTKNYIYWHFTSIN